MVARILIADDSEFMRKLIRKILETHPGFEVVAEAENGVEAVIKAKELRPDLILMNVKMPIKDGISATAEIKKEIPDIKILMCSSVSEDEILNNSMKAGADGYIIKPYQKDDVIRAINGIIKSRGATKEQNFGKSS